MKNSINYPMAKISYTSIFALLLFFSIFTVKSHAAGYVTTVDTGVARTLQAGDRILLNVDIEPSADAIGVATISAIVNADGTLSDAYITRSLPGPDYEIVPYLDGGTVTVDGHAVYATLGAQLYKGGIQPLTVSSEQMNFISQLEPQSYTEADGAVNAWPEFGGLTIASSGFWGARMGFDISYSLPLFSSPIPIGDVTFLTDLSGSYNLSGSAGGGYIDPNLSSAGEQGSLLDDLLAKANVIQVSLANTSENLGNINVSINLDMTRFATELPDIVVSSDTTGAKISEPITATIGNLTTTIIGSLGTGEVTSIANMSSIADLNQSMTSTSQALNAQFTNGATDERSAGLQQIYNLSSNLGALDASVNVDLAGVTLDFAANITGQYSTAAGIDSLESKMATVLTTAIGSLGDGTITATITNNATALTERLVGTYE